MSVAALQKRGQPQRGLFFWGTGPRPLSSTEVLERLLPALWASLWLGFLLLLFPTLP